MEKCFKCSRTEAEVRLFVGFYGLQTVTVCERCSLIENIPLIKTPYADGFNKMPHQTVRQRLSKMAGLDSGEKKEKSLHEKLEDLDNQPELEKPENINFKLVDNFHWLILRERRRKCLSQKQLAEKIQESEESIKMIEKNVLPKDALQILNKLEGFFGIQIVKKSFYEKMQENEKSFKEQDLPEVFNPFKVPVINQNKPESPSTKEEAEDMLKIAIKEETNPVVIKKEQVAGTPLKLVDFKRHSPEEITLADLKRMQERVEKDSPKKDLIQVGKEQTEDIGKEDIEKIKKRVYGDYSSFGPRKAESGKVPTIYDLMKQKQERDKELIGREIDLTDEEKDKS